MFKQKHILKFGAAFLLLVFVFANTPKKFLHDLFAKHVDTSYKQLSNAPVQLTKAGYHCDCDNLVAESSYVNDQHTFSYPLLSFFSSYIFKKVSFSSVCEDYSSLRGPPYTI